MLASRGRQNHHPVAPPRAPFSRMAGAHASAFARLALCGAEGVSAVVSAAWSRDQQRPGPPTIFSRLNRTAATRLLSGEPRQGDADLARGCSCR